MNPRSRSETSDERFAHEAPPSTNDVHEAGSVHQMTRKEIEDRLCDSERRLQLIYDQLAAGIWTTDADFVITSVHGCLANTTREACAAMIGRPVSDFFLDPTAAQTAIDAHKQALAGHTAMYYAESGKATYRCRSSRSGRRVETLSVSSGSPSTSPNNWPINAGSS
ncbi:MAG: hypothetical protein ACREIA_15300 [Opitutaceae bacterium]